MVGSATYTAGSQRASQRPMKNSVRTHSITGRWWSHGELGSCERRFGHWRCALKEMMAQALLTLFASCHEVLSYYRLKAKGLSTVDGAWEAELNTPVSLPAGLSRVLLLVEFFVCLYVYVFMCMHVP